MPQSGSINFDYVVQFECACRTELSACFYEEGSDVCYVECPECHEVYVIGKPFVGSLKGIAEDAQQTLNMMRGIEEEDA